MIVQQREVEYLAPLKDRVLKETIVMQRNPEDYLTEERLGEILQQAIGSNDFVRNKSVPNSINKRRRPDYRSEKYKLILEFDGDSHYTKAKRIKMDKEKDEEYSSLGYRIYRIPYFIQITEGILKEIFGRKISFRQKYPHGFIDSRALLPADFCELGVQAFMEDLKRFSIYREQILESLRVKVRELGDKDLVLPKSIQFIIE